MKTYSMFIFVLLASLLAIHKQTELTVSSPAFVNNGMMPSKYACDGAGISPSLNITNIPANTKSLALVIHDPDAPHPGGMTHWVVYNLPVDGVIPENFKGGVQGMNGSHTTGYKPICPPTGSHHYNIYVYALDVLLPIDSTVDKIALEKIVQGHVLGKGLLIGLYKKVNQ